MSDYAEVDVELGGKKFRATLNVRGDYALRMRIACSGGLPDNTKAIFDRLRTGTWNDSDVIDAIRCGLIGAGNYNSQKIERAHYLTQAK